MGVFGIETENHIKVIEFMNETNDRLQSPNIIKNPYKGLIKKINNTGNKTIYAVIMEPIYPKFYLWGLILFIAPYVFLGFRLTWWTFPGAVLFCTGIAWTSLLPILASFIGLRKNGYKGKVRYISSSKVCKSIYGFEGI